MKKNNLKKIKNILKISIILLIIPYFSYATSLGDIATAIASGVLNVLNFFGILNILIDIIRLIFLTVSSFILGIIGLILAFFVSYILLPLSAFFVDQFIELQNQIISQNNEIIFIGWPIVRDVTNLFFIIIIIIVAVANIIRYSEKNLNLQKILPKIILVAIIINFSLEIINVFVNFSQTLTSFFFENIISEDSSYATSLFYYLNPQRLFLNNEFIEQLKQFLSKPSFNFEAAALSFMFMPWLTTIFSLIIFASNITLSIILLIRFIVLSVLTILSPIAWFFYALPEKITLFKLFKKLGDQWVNSFFKWVFVMPIIAFFIYLTFRAAPAVSNFIYSQEAQEIVNNILQPLSEEGVDKFKKIVDLKAFANIILAGTNVSVLCGLLIAGLIIAENFSIKSAKLGTIFLNSLKTGVLLGTKAYLGHPRTGQRLGARLRLYAQKGTKLKGNKLRFRLARNLGTLIYRKASQNKEKTKPKLKKLDKPSLIGSVLRKSKEKFKEATKKYFEEKK